MLSPIDCVKRVIECDNGRDAAGYRAILHDDYRAWVHGQEHTVGADAEVAALEGWWKASSDVVLEPIAMVERDGLVTLRYTLEGTHDGELLGLPATGRRFRVENCTLLEVVDGKVRCAHRYSDTMGLMRQLGVSGG